MRVTISVTTFNEEKTVGPLIFSLFNQSKKPDEVIIVDGGSKDKTVQIIRHFQKKNKKIKLLVQKCSRSEGRNIGAELAQNEIIATTDGGCVARSDWLRKIVAPFVNPEVDISAGFYVMTGEKPMQKALSVFLGVLPSQFSIRFLPSTRSMAFRKEAWEKVGGFPESKNNGAEDTDFNYKAVKMGMKYARVKSALVEWGMPEKLGEGLKKMYDYARWDASYGVWWHPVQKFSSHNIRVLSIFARYLGGLLLFFLSFRNPPLLVVLILVFFFYLFWAFRKCYSEFRNIKVGLWGIFIQILSDFAVMSGFIRGLGRTQETRLLH